MMVCIYGLFTSSNIRLYCSYFPLSFDKLLVRLQNVESDMAAVSPDVISGGGALDKEKMSQFVEALKERSSLRLMAATLKEEVPLVYDALIGERDQYMAQAIAEANINNTVLVGVVGMMHLDGIERALVNRHGYTIVSYKNKCPKVENKLVDSAASTLPSSAQPPFNIPIIS